MHTASRSPFPPAPVSVEELEDRLSAPTERAIEAMRRLDGDIVFLGVGGKMGPTLARMALRASQAAGVARRVIGVSRFSSPDARRRLEAWGIETVACDLLNEDETARLPDAANVVAMTGFKFGASGNPSLTWAMNCYVPSLVCRRYRASRIVAFSSGNVYGLTSVDGGGSRETDPVRPDGEYAMTTLGRERMFDYFSRTLQIPMALLRLNYSTELRYGVLVDLATQVWSEQPIDVSMGHVNVLWQADANALALAAFAHLTTPTNVINLAGGDILRVRDVAEQLGRWMNKPVRFVGSEAADALLNDGRRGHQLLGAPSMPIEQTIRWTADWVARGGENLGKPTRFQVRDGKF